MDVLTHALASYVLTRAVFPRARRAALAAAVAAGTAADVDELSAFLGAPAYLRFHCTFTHSLLGAVAIPALLAAAYLFFGKRRGKEGLTPRAFFAAALCAAGLHLALDLCGSEGVALFWPVNDKRYAADWLAGLDVWILAMLAAAAVLPALFGMVKDEIGSRRNTPRGRWGFALALGLLAAYLGARAMLHANAVSVLASRTYRGELPRRVAAFAEAASPFEWNGLVETAGALHEVPANAFPAANFDPDAGKVFFKPEASAILDAAESGRAAQTFLRLARFPKATVIRTEDGFRVELRDLRYAAMGETQRALAVRVDLQADGKIGDQQIVWERELTGK